MSQLKTLAEMAEHLRCSPRTLRTYIKKYRIPHIKVGRARLFDPEKVVARLETPKTNSQKQRVVSTLTEGRFASRLGLT